MDAPPPPPVLDGARVLEYAIVEDAVKFTGALHLFVGGERLGAVPQLAIVADLSDGELMLFHCDENWNVLGAQAWNAPGGSRISSVPELKQRAERFYSGLSSHWVAHRATLEEARAYQDELVGSDRCSFCGRTMHDVHCLIKGTLEARICDHCVKEFYAHLAGSKPAD